MAVRCSEVTWTGADKISTFKSSDWAERGFCSVCRSGLFSRVTAPGDHQGIVNLPLGTLADQDGFEIVREHFIDKKPAAYAIAGERERLTEAEVFAMFGG